MRSRTGVLGAACVALVLQSGALSPPEAAQVRFWLVCFECRGGVDSIRAIGARKPVAAVDSLNRALVFGPGPLRLQRVDSVLSVAWQRDSLYRAHQGLGPGIPRPAYVAARVRKYIDGYRARGATGLGWIHTARAVRALDSALTTPLPASVRDAVIYARDSLPFP